MSNPTEGQAVIVTVRHPDFENEHHSFGAPVEIIDIDLGSSFDASKLGPDDWDQVLEWAQGYYDTADACPNDEAADFIRATAEETLALCLPYDHDGCAVSDYITRKKVLGND